MTSNPPLLPVADAQSDSSSTEPASAAARLRVVELNSDDAFAAMRDRWCALHERALHASIFNGWTWQHAWWRHYGDGHRLCILEAVIDGETVGILPLWIERQRRFKWLPVRFMRPVGTGGNTAPDDLEPLLHPLHSAAASQALAAAVLDRCKHWDVLSVSDLRGDSPISCALLDAARAHGLEGIVRTSARISFARLPDTWESYLSGLSADRRYAIRSGRRKFEATAGARLFTWNDVALLDQAVDRLAHLHRLRWSDSGASRSFAEGAYVEFHRELIHSFTKSDQVRLYAMEVQGEVIAMYYCYRFRGAVYYFQGGFDPAFEKLRPGVVLMGYAIQRAIEDGDRIFDMLRGEYDFKKQWARELRETATTEIARRTLGGVAHVLSTRRLPALKRRVVAAVQRWRVRSRKAGA